jgi:hypothetical protein
MTSETPAQTAARHCASNAAWHFTTLAEQFDAQLQAQPGEPYLTACAAIVRKWARQFAEKAEGERA